VFTYTFYRPMLEDMMEGRVPLSIADFEQIAEHYGIGSSWMGLHALNEMRRGQFDWRAFLPDGLHPDHMGSRCYAEAVIRFLERELCGEIPGIPIPHGPVFPVPLDPLCWERTELIPREAVKREGPFAIHRCANVEWIDRVLYTAAPGARISFDFTGRGLVLGCAFGTYSAVMKCRIDQGDWFERGTERAEWYPPDWWFTSFVMADELENTAHSFELIVKRGDGDAFKGSDFRLAFIGVLK